MPGKNFLPAHSYGSSREYMEFVFTAPGSGTSVAAANIDGCNAVASITHVAGTNKCTVTLVDSFNLVVFVDASVRGTAGEWGSVGGVTNEGTSTPLTFDVYTWAAAGAASNDSTAKISCSLAFRKNNIGLL